VTRGGRTILIVAADTPIRRAVTLLIEALGAAVVWGRPGEPVADDVEIAAVIAFGGLRSSAMNYPYAGEFFGNVQVNGDIFLPGADCAEQFDFAAVAEVTPGDVVVISEDGLLQLSREAYDRKVAGVISGAGSFRPGIILDRKEPQVDRLPVALMGKVFCKVDAGYGAIGVGDLLTTSHTPGHAMKAADALKSFGAVIGKALAACPAGTGLIPILVALN